MLPETEKKNQRIGMGVSIGVHGLILILFFLIMAWREPDPPVPEYGIELNFGLDAIGSGDLQSEQSSATPQLIPEQIISEEFIEETTEETPVEEVPVENLPAEDIQEVPEEEIFQDSRMEDSPDVIEPEVTQPEIQDKPVVEKEIIQETPVQQEEVDKITEEQPVARNEITTESIEEGQGTLEERAGDSESVSHGDNSNVSGDKGDPQGTLDSRALYGTYGGGGGPLLELTGWIWDFEPDPKDTSNENGRIVFEIKIDDMGEIISVRTLETAVSPAVERIYKTEVESLTFSPISSNTMPAPVSTGKITFIIRSK
jgi:outer membrane biosynthesis protein TonB